MKHTSVKTLLLAWLTWLVPGVLSVGHAGEAFLTKATPQQAPVKLRVPWPERAADLGVLEGGIRVKSDLAPALNRRVIHHVVQTRRALAPLLAGIPLQKPEAPWLLLFEEPAEMSFVVRGSYGVNLDDEKVMFFEAPFQNGQMIVATSQQPSEYGGERALQRAALKQYAFPRFGEGLPPWALVGLAEYASLLQFTEEGQVETGYIPPEFVKALQRADATDRLLPLERMLKLDPESWTQFESTHGTERLTAQAWALVHFMLHGRSGALLEPFSVWLHRVGLRKEPTINLLELLQLESDPAGISRLESAFREYHRSLEPSSAVHLRECAELCRAALEELEQRQMRPSSRALFLDELALLDPQRVLLFEKPYSRELSIRDTDALDELTIEFAPTRLGRRELERLETRPPMDVILSDAMGKNVRITWRFDSKDARWVPLIEW